MFVKFASLEIGPKMDGKILVRPNSSEDRNIEMLFEIPGIENNYDEPGISEILKISKILVSMPGISNFPKFLASTTCSQCQEYRKPNLT